MQTKEEIIEFEQEVEDYKNQLKKGQYALMLSVIAWIIVLVLFFFITPDFTVPLGIAYAVAAIAGIFGITKVVNYSDMPVYLGVISAFCMLSVPFFPHLYGIYTANTARHFYTEKTAEKWRVFYEQAEQPNTDDIGSQLVINPSLSDEPETADTEQEGKPFMDAKQRLQAARANKKAVMLKDEAEMQKTVANFFDNNAAASSPTSKLNDTSDSSPSINLNELADVDSEEHSVLISDFDDMGDVTNGETDAVVEVNVASSRNRNKKSSTISTTPEAVTQDDADTQSIIFPMVNMIIDQPKTDGSILGISYRAHDGIPQELSSKVVKSVHAVQQNHFVVNYMTEVNNQLQFLRKSTLLQRNIGLTEAHKQAIHNLNELTENGNKVEIHGDLDSGVLGITFGADLESALILVDDLWDKRLKDLYNGNYAIAVLAKNMVFIIDWENQEAVAHIHEIIPRMQEDGINILSDHLFKRHNGRWYLIA